MVHMAAADSCITPLTLPPKPVAVAGAVAAGEAAAKGTARLLAASAQWGLEAGRPGSEVAAPGLEAAPLQGSG